MFIVAFIALLFGFAIPAEYGPGVVEPVECVGVACDAERDNGFVSGGFDRPGNGGDNDDGGSKPGYGHGDKNHDHKGPPGREK